MTYYDAEVHGKSLVIRFSKQPSSMLEDLLKHAGYKYYKHIRSWVGTADQHRIMGALEIWNERINKPMKLSGATLCWSCGKSGVGDHSRCPWEARFEPVDGWAAIRQDIKVYSVDGDSRTEESYLVLECPLFEGMRK